MTPSAIDSIAGAVPAHVHAPATIDEARALVADLHARGEAFAALGAGTLRGIGKRPERLDAVVRTSRLDRVVEYAPQDQVVTVEAGMTLGALQTLLGAQGQWLALDVPVDERATLGGLIAADAYGPRRMRYGAIKDLIVGIGIVRPDGVLARGGGKVVKNVAGFDLPKLMVGSLGTLGTIVRASLRVHPVPQASRAAIVRELSAQQTFLLHRACVEARLEPAALLAVATGATPGAYTALVQFEGFSAGVQAQASRVVALARANAWSADVADSVEIERLLAVHAGARNDAPLAIKASALPSACDLLHESVLAPLAATLEGAKLALYPALGIGFAAGTPGDAAATVAALAAGRAAVEARGGSLVVHEASEAVRAAFDEWGTPPAAIALMRRIKERFDPQRRMAPGRFVGGI